MSNFKKAVSIALTVTTFVWMVGVVPAASAQTDTQSQINALLAQIQALQGQLASAQGSSATTSHTFSKDLTLGAKGDEVTALQSFLISKGDLVMPAGVAKGYFGAATKAALIKFQTAQKISPASGYFGPKTRAIVNSMSVTTTTGGTTTTTTTTGGTTTTTTGTGLTVAVDSTNPSAGNFPAGGSQIAFLKLKLSAGSSDATVTAMNVYRGGLSSDNDISNVYLMDGSTVLASNISLANAKASFSNSNGIFTVKAGTSRVITVAADISATNTSSHTYSFGVNAAADITTTGAVAGSFPINGNSFTAVSVSNPSLATLTLNNIATGGSVNAGTTSFLGGQFSLQSGNSSVSVKSIKLTETGTINAAADLSNIKLMNGTTQVGATVANLNSDGTVVFDLSSNPLQVASGATINLSVYADVVGGVNRNFRFTIQHSYDVVATDMTYNVGATVSASVSFPVQASQVSVSSGSLVVNKNANSPVNYLAPGSTGATLAKFDFKASGEAVRVTALSYSIGGYTSGAETTVWNNLKIVDDQGVQIGSTLSAGSTVATSKTNALTNLNYIIPANTTRTLSVQADIVSTYAGNVTGNIVSGTAQGYTSLSAITIGANSGNTLSTSGTAFAQSLNNAVGAISTVSGAQNVKVASYLLTAGPAEGVNVTSVTMTPGAAAASQYQNMKVMVGSTQIGNTQGTITNGSAGAFTVSASSPIAIATGGQIVVDVYADTIAGATSSAFAVQMTGAQGVGAGTNTTRTLTTTTNGQVVTVTAAGTLTTALASPAVVTQQVGMGVTSVKLGSFKFSETSNSESIDVTSIVVNSTSTAAQDILNLKLMSGTTQVGSTVVGISAAAASTTFTLSTPLNVPQNSYIVLDVIGDINTQTGGATSADTISNIGIASVNYQGHLSRATASVTTPVNTGATFTIYNTTMTPANSGSNATITTTDGTQVAQFSVAAGANKDVIVKTITIGQAGSLIQASSSVTLNIYGSDAPSTLLGTVAAATSTNTYAVSLNSTTGWTVAKGTTQNLIIKANLGSATNLVATTGAKSYQINVTAMTWNDGTTNGIAINPTVTTPIAGQANTINQ